MFKKFEKDGNIILVSADAETTGPFEGYTDLGLFLSEIERANTRTRNMRLEETDVYALADRTISDEMRTYRQALRDITTHANWPNLADGDWPTKPE